MAAANKEILAANQEIKNLISIKIIFPSLESYLQQQILLIRIKNMKNNNDEDNNNNIMNIGSLNKNIEAMCKLMSPD